MTVGQMSHPLPQIRQNTNTGILVQSLNNRPEWAKDAVFYQIFPDRFARSERNAKASVFDFDAAQRPTKTRLMV